MFFLFFIHSISFIHQIIHIIVTIGEAILYHIVFKTHIYPILFNYVST